MPIAEQAGPNRSDSAASKYALTNGSERDWENFAEPDESRAIVAQSVHGRDLC
jgi:hypothetical protein